MGVIDPNLQVVARQTTRPCSAETDLAGVLRALAVAITLVFVGLAFVKSARCQEVWEIDKRKPPDKPILVPFIQRPGDIKIEIKGDGLNYQWIRVQNTGRLDIKAIAEPGVATNDELIQGGQWYPLKKSMALTVTIPDGKEESYEFKVEFGALEGSKDPPTDFKTARAYGEDSVERQGPIAYVRLIDDTHPILRVQPIELQFSRPTQTTVMAKAPLELNAVDSKATWTFAKFKFPNKDIDLVVDPSVSGQETTIPPNEKIQSDKFYGFTGTLKLEVRRVFSQDDAPLTLSVEGGRSSQSVDSRNEAVKALFDANEVRVKGPALRVKLVTMAPEAKSSWPLILIVGSAVGIVSLVSALVVIRRRPKTVTALGDARGSESERNIHREPSSSDYLTATTSPRRHSPIRDWLFAITHWSRRSRRKEAALAEEERRAAEEKRKQEEKIREERGQLPSTAKDFNRSSHQGDSAVTASPTHLVSPSGDLARLQQLDDDAIELRQEIKATGLTEKAKQEVEGLLIPLEQKILRLHSEITGLRESLQEQQLENQRQLNTQQDLVADAQRIAKSELNSTVDNILGLLSDAINGWRTSFEEALERADGSSSRASVSRKAEDGFYAALLGAIFGQNVDALREDNLTHSAREAVEGLNRFFQEGVPKADVLDELVARADGIRTSLNEVATRVMLIDRQSGNEIAKHLNSSANLAAELSAMQGQLRSRQLTLEACAAIPINSIAEDSPSGAVYNPKIPISVSAHTSARYTFLEELGFAIRREIDKLRDPGGYFKRELERIATSDVIAVADTCHRLVVPAGKNPELEDSLQKMFSNAGLRSILPRPKDKYRPAEQNLVQISTGGTPADSQTIARVLRRGFYYDDNPTPLRKAEVEIYR